MDPEHLEFVICIDNTSYSASLELRKAYPCLPDPQAAKHQMIRVIDESGEDYLYPEARFVRIELSQPAARALAAAA